MTAARSTLSFETMIARFTDGLREAARWGLKAVLALAIIFMAGIFAVVTAGVGLIIAAVAVLLRLTGARSSRRRPSRTTQTEADGITLNAHRTARGWTVE